jgi:hypothetical protein
LLLPFLSLLFLTVSFQPSKAIRNQSSSGKAFFLFPAISMVRTQAKTIRSLKETERKMQSNRIRGSVKMKMQGKRSPLEKETRNDFKASFMDW